MLINEILASNDTVLLDEDGDSTDWVELFNSGGAPVPISGWSLSDDPALPYKWQFPDISIGPVRLPYRESAVKPSAPSVQTFGKR